METTHSLTNMIRGAASGAAGAMGRAASYQAGTAEGRGWDPERSKTPPPRAKETSCTVDLTTVPERARIPGPRRLGARPAPAPLPAQQAGRWLGQSGGRESGRMSTRERWGKAAVQPDDGGPDPHTRGIAFKGLLKRRGRRNAAQHRGRPIGRGEKAGRRGGRPAGGVRGRRGLHAAAAAVLAAAGLPAAAAGRSAADLHGAAQLPNTV